MITIEKIEKLGFSMLPRINGVKTDTYRKFYKNEFMDIDYTYGVYQKLYYSKMIFVNNKIWTPNNINTIDDLINIWDMFVGNITRFTLEAIGFKKYEFAMKDVYSLPQFECYHQKKSIDIVFYKSFDESKDKVVLDYNYKIETLVNYEFVDGIKTIKDIKLQYKLLTGKKYK